MLGGDVALIGVLPRIELNSETVEQPGGAEPAAVFPKGIVAEWIVVEDEGHAVAGVELVAHEQAERQVEIMGQVDPFVAHHRAGLPAVVCVQCVLVAAINVGGRAIEHQVRADYVGCRGVDADLADLDRADGVPFVLSANNIQ